MKIPFGKAFAVTDAQLRDGIAQGVIDGYQDHDGSYKSRAGLTLWSDLDYYMGVRGVYVDKLGLTVAVVSGRVYVVDKFGTKNLCTGDALTGNNACTFCEDPTHVFIGWGGQIAKVNTTSRTVEVMSNSPQLVTHVAMIQGYLVCNGEGVGFVLGDTNYTGPHDDAEYWTVWHRFNNEAIPDGNLATVTDGQFIYAFGGSSIELSINDGVTPWAKYQQGFIPYGIHAPMSIAKADNRFFWLGIADNAIRVLKLERGAAVTISTPYDSVINELDYSIDAEGFMTGIEGHTFYVLQFWTAKITLVYHIQSDQWYRWGGYNTGTAVYDNFIGRGSAFNPYTNSNIIGLTTGAYLTEFKGFTDNGAVIRFELTSGNVSGGTYRKKRVGRMRFQLGTGKTDAYSQNPTFQWSHRDDGGAWAAEKSRTILLGAAGHYNYLVTIDRCGMYRERQHRIVFTDTTCQFVLVDIEEYSDLGNDTNG